MSRKKNMLTHTNVNTNININTILLLLCCTLTVALNVAVMVTASAITPAQHNQHASLQAIFSTMPTTYSILQPVKIQHPKLAVNMDNQQSSAAAASSSSSSSSIHPDLLAFDVQVNGRKLVLQLEKNHLLFAARYTETRYKDGQIDSTKTRQQVVDEAHCHYMGQVYEYVQLQEMEINTVTRKHVTDMMAISTCNSHTVRFGLHGFFHLDQEMIVIEPASLRIATAEDNEHLVYRWQDLPKPHATCGVADHQHDHDHDHDVHTMDTHSTSTSTSTSDKRIHLSSLSDIVNNMDASAAAAASPSLQADTSIKRFVEVVIVNDKLRFAAKGSATETSTAAIMNQVMVLYRGGSFATPIVPVLVGQITWTNADPYTTAPPMVGSEVQVDDSNGVKGLLSTFNDWRMGAGLTVLPAHDNAQLFSAYDFQGATVGLASVSAMCTKSVSSGIDQTTHSDIFDASIVAHEMGHNFGSSHDSTGNSCAASGFIMNAVISSNIGPTQWSTCSVSYVNTFLTNYANQVRCLDNIPAYSGNPVCGDGFREDYEECDCGSSDCSSIDPCCDGSKCILKTGCLCSNQDACCTSSGQFSPSGTTCRAAVSTCDVSETCTGSSANCPVDGFLAIGTSCNDGFSGTGRCFGSFCTSTNRQCKQDTSGYSGTWSQCSTSSVSCGGLLCLNSQNNVCYSLTGLNYNNGTTCGATGSTNMCFNGACTALATVQARMPNPTYTWKTGDWELCSVACGGGKQRRLVQCISNTGAVVHPSLCPDAKPATSQVCNAATCATNDWALSDWGACSALCGGGVQTRTVSCVDRSSNAVDASLCPKLQPTNTRFCNQRPCIGPSWAVSVWGNCSTSCGTGTQTRTVACRTPAGQTVSSTQCISAAPPASQACRGICSLCTVNGVVKNCGAYGSCDINTGSCVCNSGWAGVNCTVAPSVKLIGATTPLTASVGSSYSFSYSVNGSISSLNLYLLPVGSVWPIYLNNNLAVSNGVATFSWTVADTLVAGNYTLIAAFNSAVNATRSVYIRPACVSSACLNGGTCNTATGICSCPARYTGPRCQTDLCSGVTCLNGGSCSNGACACVNGFVGATCSSKTCSLTCSNGGSVNANCTSCVCASGYSGSTCSQFYVTSTIKLKIAPTTLNTAAAIDNFKTSLISDIQKTLTAAGSSATVSNVRARNAATNAIIFGAFSHSPIMFSSAIELQQTTGVLVDFDLVSSSNAAALSSSTSLQAAVNNPSSTFYSGVVTSSADSTYFTTVNPINPTAAPTPNGGNGGGNNGDSGNGSSDSDFLSQYRFIFYIVGGVVGAVILCVVVRRCCCHQKEEAAESTGKRDKKQSSPQNIPAFNGGYPGQQVQMQSMPHAQSAQPQYNAVPVVQPIAQAVPVVQPIAAGAAPALPVGWAQYFTPQGIPYYHHAATNTTQWVKP